MNIKFVPHGSFSRLFNGINEEIKFRKLNLYQYQEQIKQHISRAIEIFRYDQKELTNEVQQELDAYFHKINQIYNETMASFRKKEAAIQHLNDQNQLRPSKIDESLEEFQRLYNQSMVNTFAFMYPSNKTLSSSKQRKSKGRLSLEPFSSQADNLHEKLSETWLGLVKQATDGSHTAKDKVHRVMADFHLFQEELYQGVRVIEQNISATLPDASSKQEIRINRQSFEEQMSSLRAERKRWIKDQTIHMEHALKTLQDTIKSADTMYDELMGKKKASMGYTLLTDETLNNALKLIDSTDQGT